MDEWLTKEIKIIWSIIMKLIKSKLREYAHSISGNTKFVKKNIIPMLRQVGITRMKANTTSVPDGEIMFSFDANKKQEEQLKQLLHNKVGKKGSAKRRKLNFNVSIREMIREEIQRLNEVNFEKVQLPSKVKMFLNKFVDSMKDAKLNRIKRSAILYRVINAAGMTTQQLMADIQKIKKELK